jgi:hypothetical protein
MAATKVVGVTPMTAEATAMVLRSRAGGVFMAKTQVEVDWIATGNRGQIM